MKFSRCMLVASCACLMLSACGSVREDLGLGRSPPDEFAVVDRPPLAMPPDFGLRPPVPGAPRPQEIDPKIRASDTLFGGNETASESTGHLSSVEKTLLEQSGADKASPDIRTVINNEQAASVDASPHLVDQLLSWKHGDQPGTVVDAAAEAERIKEAKEKGETLNQTATPVIEKEKSGWLGL
jgi:hypothetical protein